MDTIRQRLEHDLDTGIARLRLLGGAVAVEELPGPIGVNSPLADEVDEIQASQRREIGCATRELLVGRVNRLSAALDRLNDGEYGTCVECGEAISSARLHVMPEVQTCVRCQDRLERFGRQVSYQADVEMTMSRDNRGAAVGTRSTAVPLRFTRER
jgi:RNA polymerase-binding transcription factor